MPKKRDEDAPYWVQLRQAERSIIEFALEHGQSVRGTAALLGISANYLRERTRELNIVTPEIKPGPKPGTKPPARLDKPALRVVPQPPTLPVRDGVQADTVDEDQEDEPEELEDEDALDDEDDEDEDDEEDAEDDEDVDGEAQSGN